MRKVRNFYSNSNFFSWGSKFGKIFLDWAKKEVHLLQGVKSYTLRFCGAVRGGVKVWCFLVFRGGRKYISSLTHTFFDLRFHDLVLSRFFGLCLVNRVQFFRGGGGSG